MSHIEGRLGSGGLTHRQVLATVRTCSALENGESAGQCGRSQRTLTDLIRRAQFDQTPPPHDLIKLRPQFDQTPSPFDQTPFCISARAHVRIEAKLLATDTRIIEN